MGRTWLPTAGNWLLPKPHTHYPLWSPWESFSLTRYHLGTNLSEGSSSSKPLLFWGHSLLSSLHRGLPSPCFWTFLPSSHPFTYFYHESLHLLGKHLRWMHPDLSLQHPLPVYVLFCITSLADIYFAFLLGLVYTCMCVLVNVMFLQLGLQIHELYYLSFTSLPT